MPFPPIDGAELAEAIRPWRLDLREETGSTNSDAIEAARLHTPEGLVVLAESQKAGRGRLGRSWISPPRAGLWLSILVRPTVEVARWGWLPLLAGVAVAATVVETIAESEKQAEKQSEKQSEEQAGRRAERKAEKTAETQAKKAARSLAEKTERLGGMEIGLKWPNDLLIGGRKGAGILAEAAVPGAAVVGIGLNVWQSHDQLPTTPTGLPATSLQLAGVVGIDRTRLAADLITNFRARYLSWLDDPGRVRGDYLGYCQTVGREVRISLPDRGEITGEATTVDDAGRLIVRVSGGELCPIAAGDVTHVR